jgi:hypothetical protein
MFFQHDSASAGSGKRKKTKSLPSKRQGEKKELPLAVVGGVTDLKIKMFASAFSKTAVVEEKKPPEITWPEFYDRVQAENAKKWKPGYVLFFECGECKHRRRAGEIQCTHSRAGDRAVWEKIANGKALKPSNRERNPADDPLAIHAPTWYDTRIVPRELGSPN